MTIDEAIKFLKGYLDEMAYTEKCRTAHKMAIKALEQEPCEDCISRQTAIDELELQAKEMSQWSERYTEQAKGVLTAKNIIKDLPSVTPQSKTGKWIKEKSLNGWDSYSYQCSICGRSIHLDTEIETLADYPYCHCGTKMEEVEENDD